MKIGRNLRGLGLEVGCNALLNGLIYDVGILCLFGNFQDQTRVGGGVLRFVFLDFVKLSGVGNDDRVL